MPELFMVLAISGDFIIIFTLVFTFYTMCIVCNI